MFKNQNKCNGGYVRVLSVCMYLVAGILFLPSCTKNTAPPTTTTNHDFGRLTYVVQDNYTFGLFYQGLMASGYGDTLANNAGPYTLFVPNNDAMVTDGFYFGTNNNPNTTNYFLQAANPPLADYVRYLIIPKKVVLGSLPVADNQLFTTLAGTPVYISKYLNGTDTVITVNGISVIAKDEPASNGLMNVLNEVPQPQIYSSLWQQMLSNSSLIYFTTAVQLAGLQSFFDTAQNITVLAPETGAFLNGTIQNFPPVATLDQLRVADTAMLKKMVYSCVLKGRYFTSDFDRANAFGTFNYTAYNGAPLQYNVGSYGGNNYYYYFTSNAWVSYGGSPIKAQASWLGGKYQNYPEWHTTYLNVPAGNGIMQEVSNVMLP